MIGSRIPLVAEAVNGSTLCVECGMCCDGTLFTHASLLPEEVSDTRAHGGFAVEDRTSADGDATSVMLLPCVLFKDGCCSIYEEWRPRVCGDYRCRLLRDYADGTRMLDECLEIVRDVRRTASEVTAAKAAAGDEKMPTPELRMAAGVLELYMRKHFRISSDELVPSTDVSSSTDEEGTAESSA